MKVSDVENAYMFVNSGRRYEHTAFVSRRTGETYWQSEASDLDELPEDIDEDEDFIEIPHGDDLGLGTRIVWDFVRQFVPGLHDQVERAFSKKECLLSLQRDPRTPWFSGEVVRVRGETHNGSADRMVQGQQPEHRI